MYFFRNLSSLVSPLPLQKMKEYLEGRNLITKLQAKHDLLQKTLGESECALALLEAGRAERPSAPLLSSCLLLRQPAQLVLGMYFSRTTQCEHTPLSGCLEKPVGKQQCVRNANVHHVSLNGAHTLAAQTLCLSATSLVKEHRVLASPHTC